MYAGYKIVCVTPAGRRRYLRILAKYVLGSPLVDEYHLWLNTVDDADISYLQELCKNATKVHLVEPPYNPPERNPFVGIPQFFRCCTDEDTIYLRFDDDIVYLEPFFFERFLQFRVEHPEYFLVFPNIINNAICTYVQAKRGGIDADAVIYPWAMDWTAWWNPRFAEQLHRAFLQSVYSGTVNEWHFGPRILGFCWFSINCVSWFGRDFAAFGGEVTGNEEEFLTIRKPSELGRLNCIYGDAIVSHFAFYPQRNHLDSLDVLERYASLPEKPSVAVGSGAGPVRDLNIWTDRLLHVIRNIREASVHDLQDIDFVANQIRHAGLIFDRRRLYGDDNQYMNAGDAGLWQLPAQLARFLIFLSQYRLDAVLECGTGSGWTTALMTSYLVKFNPELRVTTVDVAPFFKSYPHVRKLLPIEYRVGQTSKDLADEFFDFVFIDGDHSYDGCKSDYLAVGEQASLCAFHDVNDRFVAEFDANDGGVPRFWAELKSLTHAPDRVIEFLDHSGDDRIMGIGVVVRDRVTPRKTSAFAGAVKSPFGSEQPTSRPSDLLCEGI